MPLSTKPILLEPGHPAEALDVALESLAGSLEKAFPEQRFRVVAKEQVGKGLTWWEVVRVYIPADTIAKTITGAILAEAIRWCRDRFKKVPKRPKYVAIYGPDGKVISSVLIKDPAAEPEDRTNADQASPPRLPPGAG